MNGRRILPWRPETLASGNGRPRAGITAHAHSRQKRRRVVNIKCTNCKRTQWHRLVNKYSTNMAMLWFLLRRRSHVIGGNRSIINYENLTLINILRQYIEEHPMLFTFSRGFKDIVTKTAFFKEFPCLENKFNNSRGFEEIKDPCEPCTK